MKTTLVVVALAIVVTVVSAYPSKSDFEEEVELPEESNIIPDKANDLERRSKIKKSASKSTESKEAHKKHSLYANEKKISHGLKAESQTYAREHSKKTTTSKKHWQHFDGPIGGHYGDHLHGTMWGEHLNGGNFYPGDLYEYPYPSQGNNIIAPVHPVPVIYSLPHYPCTCGKTAEDAKEIKVEKGGKGKKKARKQLVPSHYYGPPSAGWGGFKPGQTGSGWGAPYWYKSRIPGSIPLKRFTNVEPHEEEHITHMGNWGGLGRAGYGYPLRGIGYGDAYGVPGGWDHGWGEGFGHVWPVGGSSTEHGSAAGDSQPDELVGGWGTRDLSDTEKLKDATMQDEGDQQPVKKTS